MNGAKKSTVPHIHAIEGQGSTEYKPWGKCNCKCFISNVLGQIYCENGLILYSQV